MIAQSLTNLPITDETVKIWAYDGRGGMLVLHMPRIGAIGPRIKDAVRDEDPSFVLDGWEPAYDI